MDMTVRIIYLYEKLMSHLLIVLSQFQNLKSVVVLAFICLGKESNLQDHQGVALIVGIISSTHRKAAVEAFQNEEGDFALCNLVHHWEAFHCIIPLQRLKFPPMMPLKDL